MRHVSTETADQGLAWNARNGIEVLVDRVGAEP